VDDGATAALMAGVYGRVSRGIPVASALALTQAEQFAQGRHPLDWSGFVLLGGPHAIAPTRISGMEAAA